METLKGLEIQRALSERIRQLVAYIPHAYSWREHLRRYLNQILPTVFVLL